MRPRREAEAAQARKRARAKIGASAFRMDAPIDAAKLQAAVEAITSQLRAAKQAQQAQHAQRADASERGAHAKGAHAAVQSAEGSPPHKRRKVAGRLDFNGAPADGQPAAGQAEAAALEACKQEVKLEPAAPKQEPATQQSGHGLAASAAEAAGAVQPADAEMVAAAALQQASEDAACMLVEPAVLDVSVAASKPSSLPPAATPAQSAGGAAQASHATRDSPAAAAAKSAPLAAVKIAASSPEPRDTRAAGFARFGAEGVVHVASSDSVGAEDAGHAATDEREALRCDSFAQHNGSCASLGGGGASRAPASSSQAGVSAALGRVRQLCADMDASGHLAPAARQQDEVQSPLRTTAPGTAKAAQPGGSSSAPAAGPAAAACTGSRPEAPPAPDEGVHVKGPAQASWPRAASPVSSEATISVGREGPPRQLPTAAAAGLESTCTLSATAPAGGCPPPSAGPQGRWLPCEAAAQSSGAKSPVTWR